MPHAHLLVATALSALSAAVAAAAEPAAAQHRFAILDNGAGHLVLVDQVHPELGWSVGVPGGARDMQRLGMVSQQSIAKKPGAPDPLQSGEPRILVSHGDGAGEYAIATGKLLWSVKGQRGVSSARRLPDGNTLLGSSEGGVHLITVDPKGKVVSTVAVECPGDLRLVRTTPDGHFLLGLAGPHLIWEVDATGKKVAEYKLPGKGYIADRLPNGHVIAATGDGLTIVELDSMGKIVRTTGGKAAFPDEKFLWFSAYDFLPAGHLLVANWNGHGHEGQGPHVFEFDADNHLVWKWEDHQLVKDATGVLALDER